MVTIQILKQTLQLFSIQAFLKCIFRNLRIFCSKVDEAFVQKWMILLRSNMITGFRWTLVKRLRTPPQIVRPQSAFIIVDVQNDFISGSLAIINCPAGQNGEDVRWKREQTNFKYLANKNLWCLKWTISKKFKNPLTYTSWRWWRRSTDWLTRCPLTCTATGGKFF